MSTPKYTFFGDKNSRPSAARAEKAVKASISPQGFLDLTIRSRGYSTNRFNTTNFAYSNKPTELQKASYDLHMIDLIRNFKKEEFFNRINCGLSPNPCNSYQESLLHLVCRRGDTELLKIMLVAGATLEMADDMGRTPLHDCCWRAQPNFEMVEMILDHNKDNVRMFHMADSRGALPLSYVKDPQHWEAWRDFINAKKDKYWPKRNIATDGEQEPPVLTQLPPNSRPIPDPANALAPELAKMVASGRLSPEEATALNSEDDKTMTDYDSDEDYSDSEWDEEDESDYSESDSDMDDDLEAELAMRLGA